ncbi:MAG: MFS transporter [Gammaproteobacteria bacterium]|nr:MFS transporter [Gammaproteobacteria bacterium]
MFYLQAFFAFVVVLFEVPSGYVADMLGRRNALIAGSVFHAAGFTWLCFANGFVELMVFEGLVGIGMSLLSGADLSLLYDTQGALEYDPAQRAHGIANMRFARSIAEGISALIGGVLIAFSFEATVIANALFAWLPLALSLLLTEAPFTRMEQGQHIGNLRRVVRFLYIDSRLLREICLAITLFGLMTFYVVWMLQPYWQEQGIPLTAFGLLWAAQSFLFAGTMRLAIRSRKRFGAVPVLVVMALLPVAGYLGMSQLGGIVGIAFSFTFFVSRGINSVILADALNRRIPSSFRATANSMTSFMFRGIYIVTGPLVGLLIEWQGMGTTLLVLAGVAFALFVALMLPMLADVRQAEAENARPATGMDAG